MARFSKGKTEQLEGQMRPLIEEQLLTQAVVAGRLGVSEDWVQRACKRLGLETQSTGPRRGELHPDWKGGSILIKGYRFLYAPDHPNKRYGRYVAEHRLAMELKLGRYLLPGEVVHHIDKDPLNNEIENLELFQSNADHLRHELTGCIPNWTPEGKQRMLDAARKPRRSQKT